MKKTFVILILMAVLQNSWAQKVKRSDFRKDKELRYSVNSLFNDFYIQNSDIGYLTFPYCEYGSELTYWLTGYIAPHYYLFPKYWRVGLIITPQLYIRVINDKSSPVRTPSYLPGGTLFFKLSLDTIRYKYLSLAIFHHSNGQDGPPLNPDGSINTYNGNFGTNYVEGSLNFGNRRAKGNRYFKLGLEAHTGLLAYGDEPAYRERYAKMRVNVKYAGSDYATRIIKYVWKKQTPPTLTVTNEELWRTVFEGMYIVDPDFKNVVWYRKFNAELKVYRKIRGSENTSWFFSAGYLGYDYYNVYFEKHYPIFRFGLAAGNSFFNRFQRLPPKTDDNFEDDLD